MAYHVGLASSGDAQEARRRRAGAGGGVVPAEGQHDEVAGAGGEGELALVVEHVGDGHRGRVGHGAAAARGRRGAEPGPAVEEATSAGPTPHAAAQTCHSGKSNASASTASAREKTNGAAVAMS